MWHDAQVGVQQRDAVRTAQQEAVHIQPELFAGQAVSHGLQCGGSVGVGEDFGGRFEHAVLQQRDVVVAEFAGIAHGSLVVLGYDLTLR